MSATKHQAGDLLWSNDSFGFYGHIDVDAVVAKLREEADPDWAPNIENLTKHLSHDWMRWVPAQPGDDYKVWAWPAKQGTRGAFPVTETWGWR
jgi:hypothetical protein